MLNKTFLALLIAATISHAAPADAQSLGGNVALSASSVSSRVQLPASLTAYPYVLIAPAASATAEVYYALGNSSVVATTSSASLPSGGICLNFGPNSYIAGITASGTSSVNITQLSTCAAFASGGAASSGGGVVSQGSPPWADNITQFGSSNVVTGTGASGAGIPRVTVSNDSNIIATQGAAASSGPWIATPWIGGAVNSATNGLYFNPLQGNAVLSATNGSYSNILQGNAVLSASNPLPTTPEIGGAVNSATNGLFFNQLQGNSVLSLTNPSFTEITDGTNGAAAIKAASTAAVAADRALVVAISPNNTAQVGYSNSGTNPTNTLTLPNLTTAYSTGTLICTSATAATCNTALASQTLTIANSGGSATIPRFHLYSTDVSWAGQTVQIDIWTSAPTFTNGDRGSWSLATGSASHFATYTCLFSATYATPPDGLYAECDVSTKAYPVMKLSTATYYWTAQAVTGVSVTVASKTMTVLAETSN
jgi:hypothetical protein